MDSFEFENACAFLIHLVILNVECYFLEQHVQSILADLV